MVSDKIAAGIGIAALGIGTGIALKHLDDVTKKNRKHKPVKIDFKPIKFKW